MATFEDHITQARKNLAFLCTINETANSHWDWQVTTCFYTAVHLINAHLANIANAHFENHTDTLSAIDPQKNGNKAAVSQECYLAYRKLFNDSIRSRYLSIHSENKTSDFDIQNSYLTHDRHFQKAVGNLDVVIEYMASTYNLKFPVSILDCIEMKKRTYTHFKYEQKVILAK